MISLTAVLVVLAFLLILAAKFTRTPPPVDLLWLGVFFLALVHLLGVFVVVPR